MPLPEGAETQLRERLGILLADNHPVALVEKVRDATHARPAVGAGRLGPCLRKARAGVRDNLLRLRNR
jgi:hypothetical protein